MSWGDNDYRSCIFEIIEHVVEVEEENLNSILKNKKINEWIKVNKPSDYSDIFGEPMVASFTPKILSGIDQVKAALNDAEQILATNGPSNCVDRLHTALHGYLKGILVDNDIVVEKDESLTSAFKKVLSNVSVFNDSIHRKDDIKKILRPYASSIDAINTIRNQASLAHANEQLLGHDEAVLVINTVRTISTYMGSKLKDSDD
jgi:hypothetical protein